LLTIDGERERIEDVRHEWSAGRKKVSLGFPHTILEYTDFTL
jgi:hypothetical protein